MPDSKHKKPNSKQKPLRYNNSRLENARKAIVKEMKTTLPEESNELESSSQKEVKRISQYLNAALAVYIKNGKRKVSKSRQATIDKIRELINEAGEKNWRKVQLLANIQFLFHSQNYNYGPFGNSELADLIKVATALWKAENREDEKQKQQQAHTGPVIYATSLKDFLLFGLQQFKDLYVAECGKTEKAITDFEKYIQPSIDQCIERFNVNNTDEELINTIDQCQNQALRTHLLKTVEDFNSLKPEISHFRVFKDFIDNEECKHLSYTGKPSYDPITHITLKDFVSLITNKKFDPEEVEFLLQKVIDIIKKIQREQGLPLPQWVTPVCYFLRKHAIKYPEVQMRLKEVTGNCDFMTIYNRTLNMRTWKPETFGVPEKQSTMVEKSKEERSSNEFSSKETKSKKKVILAIHGLNDSSATWEAQACDWAKEGYTVISFDLAGHGQDIYRDMNKKNPPLNLQLIQFDLRRQLHELENSDEWGEVHIAAHSMGGALVAQSLKTINDDFKKIKSITLHAPATFETPTPSILRAAPHFGKGDREEIAARTRNEGNSGLGGPGVGRSSAKDFIKLTDSYKSLEAVAAGRVELRDDLSLLVIAGEDDKLSRKGNFEALKKVRSVFTNLKICILKKVGHSLHEPGSATQELTGAMVLHHAKHSTDGKAIEERKKLRKDFKAIKAIITNPLYDEAFRELLIPRLQKVYEKGNAVFQQHIIREFQLGNIDFETLIKLNRLTIDPDAEHIDCNEFSSCLAPKDNKKDKFSATTTASHFKELNAIARKSDNPGQTNKIYKSEIAMILKLRDERNHYTFFRGGELKTNSYTFFTGTKQLKENAKLNQKDEVIQSLKNANFKTTAPK